MTERIEVQRTIAAPAADIFALLCDPQGHVAIDASGMLQDADGDPVQAAGDSFVVHMDREALNDFPLGRYDVTVTITTFVPDRKSGRVGLAVHLDRARPDGDPRLSVGGDAFLDESARDPRVLDCQPAGEADHGHDQAAGSHRQPDVVRGSVPRALHGVRDRDPVAQGLPTR